MSTLQQTGKKSKTLKILWGWGLSGQLLPRKNAPWLGLGFGLGLGLVLGPGDRVAEGREPRSEKNKYPVMTLDSSVDTWHLKFRWIITIYSININLWRKSF